jgi:hypothetical protein
MLRREFLHSTNVMLIGLGMPTQLSAREEMRPSEQGVIPGSRYFTFVSINQSNSESLLFLNGSGNLSANGLMANGGYAFVSTYEPSAVANICYGTWHSLEIISTSGLNVKTSPPNQIDMGEVDLKIEMTGASPATSHTSVLKLRFNKSLGRTNGKDAEGVALYMADDVCFTPLPGFGKIVMS